MSSPICEEIMAVAAAAPPPEPPAVALTVPAAAVRRATDLVTGDVLSFTILIYAQANATDNVTNNSQVVTDAEGSFIFDTTGRMTVDLIPPERTEYFEHEQFVEFSLNFSQCGNISHVEGTCNPTHCASGLTCQNAPEKCCEEGDWTCCGAEDADEPYFFNWPKFANRLYCPVGSLWPVMCNWGVCALDDYNCDLEYGGVKMNGDVCRIQVFWWLLPDENQTGSTAWTESAEAEANSSHPHVRMPIAELPRPGVYEVKALVPNGGEGLVLEVGTTVRILESPLPVAALSAAPGASVGCPVVLNASGSLDPIEDEIRWAAEPNLTYKWACEHVGGGADLLAQQECDKLGRVAGNPAVVAIDFQMSGSWLFTLTVTREFDKKFSVLTHLVAVVDGVAATMAQPPAEVSAQLDLTIEPYVEENPACNAPAVYRSLWMLQEADGDISAWFLTGPTTSKALLIAAPWAEAPPGVYRLRLVLTRNESSGNAWQYPADWDPEDTAGPWIFDSGTFLIDEPPTNGSSGIHPLSGNMTTTKFTITSSYWVDDDLPLAYRFSWHAGSSDAASPVWRDLSSGQWSSSPVFGDMVFASVGPVTVRSAAKDTLGSVSVAFDAEAEVVYPPVPAEDDVLLEVLSDVASGGNYFSTLAAVDAVADTSSDRAETDASYDSTQIASDLLGVVDSSMPSDMSAEEISGTISVIGSVLTTAMRGQALALDPSFSLQASGLITTVAQTAASTGDGISVDDAASLVGSVANLLPNKTSDLTAESSDAETDAAIMEALEGAVNAIGDAVTASMQVGDEPVTVSVGGISLTAAKATVENMADGLTVGGFDFPSGFDLSEEARRLSASCSSSEFSLQHTAWPSNNPFSWAGDYVYGNLSTADEDAVSTTASQEEAEGEYDRAWAVDQAGVQSMNIRACGATQKVEGLQKPIRFFLHAPLEFNATGARRAVRRCVYFDKNTWSTMGVQVVNETEDGIWCETTHLSSFTAVHGSFSITSVLNLLCPNTGIISAEGVGNVLKGSWWYEPGGLMIWILLLMHVAVVVTTRRAYRKNKEVAKLTNQLTGDLETHQGHMKQLVNKCVRCKCEELFFPETWAVVIGKVLKESVDPEEFEDADISDVARALTISKLRTLKSHGLRRGGTTKSCVSSNGENTKGNATMSRVDVTSFFRKSSLPYLWAVHPILRLTVPSKRHPVLKRMYKLLVSVFGSLAVSALFYASSGAASHDSDPACRGGFPWESWTHLIRALLVAVFSTFLVTHLANLLMTFVGDRHIVTMCFGTLLVSVYLAGSICYCILFLANVSIEDGCAWLVSALFRFTMFWLFTPMMLTVGLSALERMLVGHQFQSQDDLQAVQFALAGARQVEEAPSAVVETNNGLRVAAQTPKSWPRQPQSAKVHPVGVRDVH